jgi:hypothetical protein
MDKVPFDAITDFFAENAAPLALDGALPAAAPSRTTRLAAGSVAMGAAGLPERDYLITKAAQLASG